MVDMEGGGAMTGRRVGLDMKSDNSRSNVLTRPVGVPYIRTMEELANALRTVRGQRELTQAKAASQAGVSAQLWSDVENKKRRPRATTVARLERWLAKGER